MPPPPRSTPACRRTSAPAPCAVTWTPPSLRPWRPTAVVEHETQGRIRVAAARADGRTGRLYRHRTGPAATRTRHRSVRLPGPPSGLRHPRAVVAAGPGRPVRHPVRHPGRPGVHHRRERRSAQDRHRRPASTPGSGREAAAPPGPDPARAVSRPDATDEQYETGSSKLGGVGCFEHRECCTWTALSSVPCLVRVGVERPVIHSTVKLLASSACLLYTSDAADEEDSVDLGGRR